MPRDLITDANDNLRRTFVTLAAELPTGETRQFGPLWAVYSGLPAPIYNRVFVFEPPPPDDLSAAVAWMSERDVPFWVTATDAAVDSIRGHDADQD